MLQGPNGSLRHFVIVHLQDGLVVDASHTWVLVKAETRPLTSKRVKTGCEAQLGTAGRASSSRDASAISWHCSISNQEPLLRTDSLRDGILIRTVFDAHVQEWSSPVALDACQAPMHS